MRIHPRVSFANIRKFYRRDAHATATREFCCVVDAKARHNGEIRWRVRFKPGPDGFQWPDEWVDEMTLEYYGAGHLATEHAREQEDFQGGHLAFLTTFTRPSQPTAPALNTTLHCIVDDF